MDNMRWDEEDRLERQSIDKLLKKERAVLIQTKKALHRFLDEMIMSLPVQPKEIGICKSYIELDEEMYLTREYKGIELTYYNEWFAQGKIIVR